MMETYLGEVPDSLEALEFLDLPVGGGVTHCEVLSATTKGVKNKQISTKINSFPE